MKYFMMKRVMLAIALPVLVAYFGVLRPCQYIGFLFFHQSMLCATALVNMFKNN
jgi:hypothetical protein